MAKKAKKYSHVLATNELEKLGAQGFSAQNFVYALLRNFAEYGEVHICLIDCVVKMAEGNTEFKLIVDQKVAYQNILWAYIQFILIFKDAQNVRCDKIRFYTHLVGHGIRRKALMPKITILIIQLHLSLETCFR